MIRFRHDRDASPEQHRLPMSSMIDVVFLLLVFFIMTFKITPIEGDLSIGGTEATGSIRDQVTVNLPLTLRLVSGPDGQLQAMQLNGQQAASFAELQAKLIELKYDGALNDVVLDIDSDANLKYQNLIEALDHVTAFRDSTGQEQALVSGTRFTGRS